MLPIVVKTYTLPDGRRIRVVRDDLLPGGTKQRALLEWMPAQSSKHFVFGSAPATGYAQVALPLVARAVGATIKLFMAKRRELHPRTVRSLEYGADITFLDFGMLSNTEAHARRYAAETGAYLLPIGLEAPGVLETLARQAKTIRPAPKEFWSVVGGGTLNRALQLAWPDAAAHAVMVGHDGDTGRATRWYASEKYQQSVSLTHRPPFPSVETIDAKAWRFILEHASDGALFWNVAADPEETLDTTGARLVESIPTLRSSSKEIVQMATAKLIQAKYKGFTLTAAPDGEKIKIISVDAPEGVKIPAAESKKLINVVFDSWGKAGRAGTDMVTTTLKLPTLPSDRRMVFYREGESRPVNSRDVGTTPAPKASKPVAEKPVKAEKPAKVSKTQTPVAEPEAKRPEKVAKNDAAAKAEKAARKPGAVTKKAGESAKAKSAKSPKARAKVTATADDAEDLDI